MSDNPEHPFITARHADNIVEAANKLGRDIRTDAETRAKEHLQLVALHTAGLAQQAEALAALTRIAENTANLPALMAVLMTTKTNGSVAHADDNEGDPL